MSKQRRQNNKYSQGKPSRLGLISLRIRPGCSLISLRGHERFALVTACSFGPALARAPKQNITKTQQKRHCHFIELSPPLPLPLPLPCSAY